MSSSMRKTVESSDELAGEDAPELGPKVELQLSEMSLNGLDTSHTMKLFGTIGQHTVKVMIDSGASHCFISDALAQRLQLLITPTFPYSVTLGDGSTQRAAGICQDVPLVLAEEIFTPSCYIFPLRNIDVILGVSWLASLGYVWANCQHQSMDFLVEGRPVSLMRRACSPQDLRSLIPNDCCWYSNP